MNGLRGFYAKWNNSVKDDYCLIDFSDMWNLRKKMNKYNNKNDNKTPRQIDIENKQAVTRAKGFRGMGEIGEKE